MMEKIYTIFKKQHCTKSIPEESKMTDQLKVQIKKNVISGTIKVT